MKLFSFDWLAALIAVFCVAVPIAQAGEVEAWKRHPLATAPYLENPPTIDGQVDRLEWQQAGVLGPLLVHPQGVAGDLNSRVYVGYDQAHLYVAFEIVRPANVAPPLMPEATGRLDSWAAGEFVELMLDVGHTQQQYYDFNVYPNGAYSDGMGKPSVDRHWNPEWKQAARLTDQGWQGEVAIPFAALGLDRMPTAGEVWGLDFINNQRTPFAQLSMYAYRGPAWHKLANFGHLRFGERGVEPAVRFMQAQDAGQGSAIVEFALVNGSQTSTTMQVDVQLLRRKDGLADGTKSYYDHIESGSDDAYESGQSEFAKTTTLESLTTEAAAMYEPVSQLHEEVVIPAGQRKAVGFVKAVESGEFLVLYAFRRMDGQVVAAGAKVFQMTPPLALSFEAYWLHAMRLDISADLRKLATASGSHVTFGLFKAGDDSKPLATSEVPFKAGASQVKSSFSTADLPAGFYEVEASVIGKEGKVLATNRRAIEKPPTPVWHGNKLGKTLKVPSPWTPLKATPQGIVEVWGRTYDLSTLLPAQIESQGHPLLTSPIQLELSQAGHEIEWRTTALDLVSADEAKAVFRGTLESSVATVSGIVSIEFDGLVWYDLILTPSDKTLTVDHLSLRIDLSARHAALMSTHTFLHDPVISKQAVQPARQGPLGVLADSLLPFSPHVWLGDETGGIAWMAEAPIDWHITQPDRVIEVNASRRGSDAPATMRVHLIQDKLAVRKPRRLVFGLQASPIRAMPPVNTAAIVQAGAPVPDASWYQSIRAHGGSGVVFHSGWKGQPRAEIWGGWPERPPDPAWEARLVQAVKDAQQNDLKVALYTGWGIAMNSDAWQHYKNEFARKPLENAGFGTYRQAAGISGAYQDYMAWAIADLIKTYGVDGVFWDSTSNLREDTNIEIGNGWVDDQGRVRPSFAILGTRELFKRIYTLVHGELKADGLVINFGGSIWAINAFADVFHRGEGIPMHVAKLRDAWQPLEDYRANYDARKHGLASLAMNKNFKNLPMTVNTHHAVTLLHGWHCKSTALFTSGASGRFGYDRLDSPIYKIWQAGTWLPLDETAARHHYYDDASEYLSLTPASLLASVFVSGDAKRALLVVSNLDDQPVDGASVMLKHAILGSGKEGRVLVEDAITGEKLSVEDGVIKLSIQAERYRLLKLFIAE